MDWDNKGAMEAKIKQENSIQASSVTIPTAYWDNKGASYNVLELDNMEDIRTEAVDIHNIQRVEATSCSDQLFLAASISSGLLQENYPVLILVIYSITFLANLHISTKKEEPMAFTYQKNHFFIVSHPAKVTRNFNFPLDGSLLMEELHC